MSKKGKKNSYNRIILDAVGFSPSCHNPDIIVGDEDDLIHALGLELFTVLDERSDVGNLACWGESSGNSNQDNLLIFELYSLAVSTGWSPFIKDILR
jgi:hypothetical protein